MRVLLLATLLGLTVQGQLADVRRLYRRYTARRRNEGDAMACFAIFMQAEQLLGDCIIVMNPDESDRCSSGMSNTRAMCEDGCMDKLSTFMDMLIDGGCLDMGGDDQQDFQCPDGQAKNACGDCMDSCQNDSDCCPSENCVDVDNHSICAPKGMPHNFCDRDLQGQYSSSLLNSGILCAQNEEGHYCADFFDEIPFGASCDDLTEMGCCASTFYELHANFFPAAVEAELKKTLNCEGFSAGDICDGMRGSHTPGPKPTRDGGSADACRDHDAMFRSEEFDGTCADMKNMIDYSGGDYCGDEQYYGEVYCCETCEGECRDHEEQLGGQTCEGLNELTKNFGGDFCSKHNIIGLCCETCARELNDDRRDENGCIGALGYRYCRNKDECWKVDELERDMDESWDHVCNTEREDSKYCNMSVLFGVIGGSGIPECLAMFSQDENEEEEEEFDHCSCLKQLSDEEANKLDCFLEGDEEDNTEEEMTALDHINMCKGRGGGDEWEHQDSEIVSGVPFKGWRIIYDSLETCEHEDEDAILFRGSIDLGMSDHDGIGCVNTPLEADEEDESLSIQVECAQPGVLRVVDHELRNCQGAVSEETGLVQYGKCIEADGFYYKAYWNNVCQPSEGFHEERNVVAGERTVSHREIWGTEDGCNRRLEDDRRAFVSYTIGIGSSESDMGCADRPFGADDVEDDLSLSVVCDSPGVVSWRTWTDRGCTGEVEEQGRVNFGVCDFHEDGEDSYWSRTTWMDYCTPANIEIDVLEKTYESEVSCGKGRKQTGSEGHDVHLGCNNNSDEDEESSYMVMCAEDSETAVRVRGFVGFDCIGMGEEFRVEADVCERDDASHCTIGHDSRDGETSEERCLDASGCCYDEDSDHCWQCEDNSGEDEVGQSWSKHEFTMPQKYCGFGGGGGDFWATYDGDFADYKEWCEDVHFQEGNKKSCVSCGGKFKKGNGSCTVASKKKVKCKKLSTDFCENIGCKLKNGKCSKKPQFN